MKKKKSKNRETIQKKKDEKNSFHLMKLNEMKNAIIKNSNKVPLYNIFFDVKIKQDTESFYDMTIYNIDKPDFNEYSFKNDLEKNTDNNKPKKEKLLSCKKVILKPTNEQRKKLLNMMEGYRKVYNLTLKFIKNRSYLKSHSEISNEITEKKVKEEKEPKIKKIKIKKNDPDSDIKNEVLSIINNNIIDVIEKNDKEERKEEISKEKKEKRILKVNELKNNNDLIIDDSILKTYFLKDNISYISKKHKTPIHTLNYAVKLACSSYKSCLTNLKNKNIRYFNVRYIKTNKKSLIMDIEKGAFRKSSFFVSELGNIFNTKIRDNGTFFDFKVNHDCKLHYNKNTKVFTLLIPEDYIESYDYKLKIYNKIKNDESLNFETPRKIKEPKNNIPTTKENYISIDPGLRTFLSCKTNKNYIEIGSEMKSIYTKILNDIDNINKINEEFLNNNIKIKKKKEKQNRRKNKRKNQEKNKIYKNIERINQNTKMTEEQKDTEKKKLIEKLKRKLERKKYERIQNLTADLHWKITFYLTTNYKNVIIGKWSTKSIISNETSVLSSENKRYSQTLSFYKFLQKLKFKCIARKVSLRIQDEYYTSKVCTKCMFKNDKLKGDEIFKCPNCNLEIKRDYNGSRNIMLKSIN